jgi:hypothetical protein
MLNRIEELVTFPLLQNSLAHGQGSLAPSTRGIVTGCWSKRTTLNGSGAKRLDSTQRRERSNDWRKTKYACYSRRAALGSGRTLSTPWIAERWKSHRPVSSQ